MARRKFLEVRNIDRAKHMWKLLGQPRHAELLGHETVEDWEILLEECDAALKLAVLDAEKE